MGKQKDLSVETLRGIAILLVVAGHVIGSAPDGGMKIDFPSPWRYIYLWIAYIQMPLFTAIAGWVYALKPLGNISPGRFIRSKALRLLVPMATVSTLYFLTQYIVPGTNSKASLDEIWKIFVFPYTIFWYLQSLFLIFVVVMAAERLVAMSTLRGWLTTLGVAIILYIVEIVVIPYEVPNVFSFKGAIDQLPYFIAGIGIYRFGASLYERFRYIFASAALVGIALMQIKWFYPEFHPVIYRCLLPLWLVPSLFIAFRITVPNRFFVFLGAYAYSIYLFHGFGTSGGRIILSTLGIHNQIAVFAFALIIALLLPVAADKILSKNRLLGTLLFGKPYNNSKK